MRSLVFNAMHILVVPSWYTSNSNPAAGSFFRAHVQALRTGGIRVGVIAPTLVSATKKATGYDHPVYECDGGVPTFRYVGRKWLPLLPLGNATLWARAAMRLFHAYVSRYGHPDLIQAHAGLYAGYFAAKVKQQLDIPYVLTEHSSFYARSPLRRRLYGKEIRMAYGQADATVVVSNALGVQLSTQIPLMRGDRIVIPNVLDGKFLGAAPVHQHGSEFTFLNVGIMTPIKGQDIIIRAFAKSFAGQPGVYLKIGGDGPLRNDLQSLSRKLGIERQVKFLGLLDRDQVLYEMGRANAFVLGSTYETFGVVVIEALACGTPVIATTCGGPEGIVNAENGILVPTNSVDQMSAAMSSMQQRYALFNRDNIRDVTIAHYGPSAIAAQYHAVYRDVLERRMKSPGSSRDLIRGRERYG